MLQCTSGLATSHSAFLHLIDLTRGGFASADSPLVARCHQACLVESGRRCWPVTLFTPSAIAIHSHTSTHLSTYAHTAHTEQLCRFDSLLPAPCRLTVPLPLRCSSRVCCRFTLLSLAHVSSPLPPLLPRADGDARCGIGRIGQCHRLCGLEVSNGGRRRESIQQVKRHAPRLHDATRHDCTARRNAHWNYMAWLLGACLLLL